MYCAFRGMVRNLARSVFAVAFLIAAPVTAQDRRIVVFGEAGHAALGHADSQQGRAPIFGGGAAFHLTPHLVIEGDVQGGRVEHVFGRRHHDFTELTMTASLLFRAPSRGRIHFIAGGGLALQRAHTVIDEPPFRGIDEVERLNLWHGRIGADWDASRRLVIRTDAVAWIGEGLDWVVGGRVGLGYRF
jgi:hypothetical protein